MEEKFSFLLFIITILDIYFNYNVYEFPQYHNVRIYSGIFVLISLFIPFLLITFICLMGCLFYYKVINNEHIRSCNICFTIISSVLVVNLTFGSIIFQIYSIYLYFFCTGSLKIKSVMIKVFMFISLISIFIKMFFAICNLISSLNNRKNDNSESSEGTELQKINEVNEV